MGSGTGVPRSLVRKSLLKEEGSTDFAQITIPIFSLPLSLAENLSFSLPPPLSRLILDTSSFALQLCEQ